MKMNTSRNMLSMLALLSGAAFAAGAREPDIENLPCWKGEATPCQNSKACKSKRTHKLRKNLIDEKIYVGPKKSDDGGVWWYCADKTHTPQGGIIWNETTKTFWQNGQPKKKFNAGEMELGAEAQVKDYFNQAEAKRILKDSHMLDGDDANVAETKAAKTVQDMVTWYYKKCGYQEKLDEELDKAWKIIASRKDIPPSQMDKKDLETLSENAKPIIIKAYKLYGHDPNAAESEADKTFTNMKETREADFKTPKKAIAEYVAYKKKKINEGRLGRGQPPKKGFMSRNLSNADLRMKCKNFKKHINANDWVVDDITSDLFLKLATELDDKAREGESGDEIFYDEPATKTTTAAATTSPRKSSAQRTNRRQTPSAPKTISACKEMKRDDFVKEWIKYYTEARVQKSMGQLRKLHRNSITFQKENNIKVTPDLDWRSFSELVKDEMKKVAGAEAVAAPAVANNPNQKPVPTITSLATNPPQGSLQKPKHASKRADKNAGTPPATGNGNRNDGANAISKSTDPPISPKAVPSAPVSASAGQVKAADKLKPAPLSSTNSTKSSSHKPAPRAPASPRSGNSPTKVVKGTKSLSTNRHAAAQSMTLEGLTQLKSKLARSGRRRFGKSSKRSSSKFQETTLKAVLKSDKWKDADASLKKRGAPKSKEILEKWVKQNNMYIKPEDPDMQPPPGTFRDFTKHCIKLMKHNERRRLVSKNAHPVFRRLLRKLRYYE